MNLFLIMDVPGVFVISDVSKVNIEVRHAFITLRILCYNLTLVDFGPFHL